MSPTQLISAALHVYKFYGHSWVKYVYLALFKLSQCPISCKLNMHVKSFLCYCTHVVKINVHTVICTNYQPSNENSVRVYLANWQIEDTTNQ